MSDSFPSFERAFRANVNGCRRTCECGIEYWDTYNEGYTWGESELEELEQLQQEGKARPLDYAVGVVEFEGREYVDGCSCWHERAERVIGFLNAHAEAIAEYLSLEKERLTRQAAAAPVVRSTHEL